jgi:hypothetical protein
MRRPGSFWRVLAAGFLVVTLAGAIPAVMTTPVAVAQDSQEINGSDASAGATGQNGTVNGQPRETADTAPVVTTGPGAPLPPPAVNLPPSAVLDPSAPPADTGATAAGIDPNLGAGIASTSPLNFSAVADTTVFTSAPSSPQSPESAGLLALGGPQGAVAVMSFDVSGIGGGTVLSALLTFTGAGDNGAPGGSVEVIYGYTTSDGITANDVPAAQTATNVQGAPSWFERVEPGGQTSVDVTGSVTADGQITFVLPGQSEKSGTVLAIESGAPPQLSLTVAQPG